MGYVLSELEGNAIYVAWAAASCVLSAACRPGVAYVNGFNLGRYWLRNGRCSGDCAPPQHGDYCYERFKDCDTPTQTLYHIPTDVSGSSCCLRMKLDDWLPCRSCNRPTT